MQEKTQKSWKKSDIFVKNPKKYYVYNLVWKQFISEIGTKEKLVSL